METLTKPALADICPKAECGQVMTTTVRENAVIRHCLACGYEAVDIGLGSL